MLYKKLKGRLYFAILKGFLFSVVSFSALAEDLPSSADPSRIKLLESDIIRSGSLPSVPAISTTPSVELIPDAAKTVEFHLNQIKLQGITAFTEAELSDIYQNHLQKNISLDYIWKFTNDITKRYQDAGYFLSRAYIPEQEIENGIVVIQVVEGYISEVKLDENLLKEDQIQQLISRFKTNRPINAYSLESFMLQMNALPGQQFRAVVEPIKNGNSGEAQLLLISTAEDGHFSINLTNNGSRFLGPYQFAATYQDSFLPLQQTTLSTFTSIPTNELQSVAFNHSIPLYPDFKIDLFGDYVNAYPGDSLENLEIESKSSGLGARLSWQPIRQRLENLITTFELSGKNTDSYILEDTVQTRDRIRAMRLKLNYDIADSLGGYNYVFFSINQGLKILNSSEKEDSNLSRSEAEPDFTTLQFDYTRQQIIIPTFMMVTHLSGQIASAPVFSSEEFGYGGQVFGRAYDPSEITGDHGVSASIELRYLGFNPWKESRLTPYTFYDIGKVWNEDSDGVHQSAASSGFGIDWRHSSGFNAQIGLAWPLTRDASNPIYGGDGSDPRFMLQLSYQN